MFKKLPFMLIMMLSVFSAQARYKGTTPAAGQQYYLLNVYQGKFLTTGDLLITGKQGTPTAYTTDTETTITVNGTTYTISEGDYGYLLKNGDNALRFNSGTSCTAGATDTPATLDCAQWLFVSSDEYNEMQAKHSFTMACLNVDGMPSSIKVYGIYTVNLNPDAKEGPGATAIGTKLKTSGWDVVGLSEDFNFHSELWNAAWNDGVDNENGYCYNATANGEKLDGSKAGILTNYNNKKTLFDTDGLCLFHRVSRLNVSGDDLKALETLIPWEEHYGYTDSGADGLIKKGFRHIVVSLNNGTPGDTSDDIELDVYILHMDAETNPGDNAARESQMKQLTDYILATSNGRPIIVMGDTNCRYTRDPLKKKFVDAINKDPRFVCKDVWVELCLDGSYPLQNGQTITVDDKGYRLGEVVDKMFYINNTESNYRIQPELFRQDLSFINGEGEPLADHWPIATEFSYHTYDPMVDDVLTNNVEMSDVYLRNKATGMYLTIGGTWATHAMQGTYGTPMTISQTTTGHCMIMSTSGGLGTNGYMDRPEDEAKVWTMAKHINGSYVFSYVDDSGTRRALTGNDPFVFNWGTQEYHQPVTQYATTDLPTQSLFNMEDTYQQWEILTKADLLAEARKATSENPYDLTFLLPGANFNRLDSQNMQWSQTFSDGSRSWANLGSSGYAEYNEYGNFVGEVYMKNCEDSHTLFCRHYATWDIYKEIDVPNGTYNVSCQAFYRAEGGSPTVKFYANSSETGVSPLTDNLTTIPDGALSAAPNSMNDAALVFNGGQYGLTLNKIVVTNGKLRIGIKKTSNSSKSDKLWTCFDNFQIKCIGITPSAYETAHANARAKVSTSLAAAAAVNDYPYEMEAAIDEEYDVATATAVLNNAVTMANNNDDATSLLTNADFSQNTTGWNFRLKLNDDTEKKWDAGTVNGALDVWRGDFFKESELSQTLANLPNGTYKVSADFMTWASDYLKGDGSRATDGHSWIGFFGYPAGGYISRTDNIVGDAPTQGQTGTFTRYTFYVTVPNHNLTIGVRNDHTRFFQIKDVTVEMVNPEVYQNEVAKGYIYQDMCWMDHNAMEYDITADKYAAAEDVDVRTGGFVQQPNALIRANIGTIAGNNVIVGDVCENLVLTDKEPFANSAGFTATNATYDRTMGRQWGTVMLPYDVKSNSDVQFYTLKSVSTEENGVMNFAEAETLEAGTPGVFVKLDENAGNITLNGSSVTVKTANGEETAGTDVTGWTLKGTYSQLNLTAAETAANNLYFISGDQFWHATGTLTVAPFRAYFEDASSSGVKAFRLVADNDADGVQLVPVNEDGQEVYTLSGVRLSGSSKLKAGIYIINNKKTVVK